MARVTQYKIYCQTEAQWKTWVLPEADSAPTTCPTDTAHSVLASSVSIDRHIGGEPATTPDDILYTVPHPSSMSYEMCDRDLLIKTATYDARAAAVLAGVDANGDIAYSATTPGTFSNRMSVEHATGDTGAGHENRALNAAFTADTYDLVVTFGTDGSGNSVTPTAQQVFDMVSARTDIMMCLFPTLLGDGTSNVQVVAKTSLAGGTSPSVSDVKIHPTTYVKGEWEELQQVGVYKSDGGSGYTLCSDQADADVNAVLSVWRYCAHHQTTGMPQLIEIRDGLLVVDSTISDSLEHMSFAIAAPQVPAASGGSVVQFDAYLKFFKGKVLGATSPQAKALDPSGPAGMAGCELRIYVYYPAGAKHEHVLRLVTYRPPGTF